MLQKTLLTIGCVLLLCGGAVFVATLIRRQIEPGGVSRRGDGFEAFVGSRGAETESRDAQAPCAGGFRFLQQAPGELRAALRSVSPATIDRGAIGSPARSGRAMAVMP